MVGAFIPWYQGSELFRITMCGIAGYFNHCGLDGVDLGRMASAIAHRGPDGDGFYVKSDTGTGLAHRRLAILDLSEMGKQPMTYADSGCWISYNGELYNYIELRAELKTLGCSFSTNTDTEVLLASYCMWGIESFRRFNGMFSFAIYDEPRNKLLLCRDNFGIKPLYYWRSEQRLVFGSELKVFAAVAAKLGIKWDERAIRTCLTSNYTLESTEFSLFKGVNRLLPGCYIEADARRLDVRSWWRTADHPAPPPGGVSAQRARFGEMLVDACRIRTRSDVPLAASLSGGLDSSSIVSVLNGMGFSLTPFIHRFENRWLDETNDAASVAEAANLEPVYVEIDEPSNFDMVDEFTYALEGITSSILPSSGYRVYRAQSRCGFKVSLDGHGSDEMLAGYYWQLHAARKDCGVFSPKFYQLVKMQSEMGAGLPHALERIAVLLGARKAKPAYQPVEFSNPGCGTQTYEPRHLEMPADWSHLQRKLYQSFHAFTLPTTLHSVDLLSMANSVEARLPFLDYRLVDYVFSLPDEQKVNRGFSKFILRESMRGVLPEPIRTRKVKIPFTSPAPSTPFVQKNMRPWIDAILHDSNPLEGIVCLKTMREFYHRNVLSNEFSNAGWQSFCSHLNAIRLVRLFNERFSLS